MTLVDKPQYILERKETYNHRTTPLVVWKVINTKTNWSVAECKTKKEALEWLAIYSS